MSSRRDRDALIGEQIAEGYRRIPQGTVDEWGDLLVSNQASRTRVLERLEAEERAAGFEPWWTASKAPSARSKR